MKIIVNTKKNILKTSFKKNRIFLYIGLLFLIFSLIIFYKGYLYENQDLPIPISFYDLKTEDKKNVNKYSYLDINTIPSLFAVYESYGQEENQKFYFVMDNKNNLYILYMNYSTFKKLNNENIKNTPVRVYGITKKIKTDVKKIAINTYNKIMSDEYLNNDNFKNYVGSIYLDLNQKYYDATYYYLISLILLINFFILISIYFKNFFNNKKIFKKYQKELIKINLEIKDLLNNNKQVKDKKNIFRNLYLTKNYVVSLNSKLIIIKYKEIENIYPYEFYQSGILINKGISLVTSTKIYNIRKKSLNIFKDDNQSINIIIKKIKNKNKKIIIGYDEIWQREDVFKKKEVKKFKK